MSEDNVKQVDSLSVTDHFQAGQKSGSCTVHLIDTENAVVAFIHRVLKAKESSSFSIAVDLEGVDLGATGEICIMQLILSRP